MKTCGAFSSVAAIAQSVLLLGALLLPTACTSSISLSVPSSSPKVTQANSEIPKTNDLDADNTRKLFLIVVDGLRKQGKARAGLAFLDDYNRRYPNDPAAMMLQANCLLDIGEYDRAEPLYTALLTGARGAPAYAGLGSIAAARHDWSNAVTQFEEATRRDASNAAYVNDLGFALIHVGRYDRGLAKLEEATQLDPSSRVARNNLIVGLVLSGHGSEAAQMVDQITDPQEHDRAGQLLHVSTAANDTPRAAPSKPE